MQPSREVAIAPPDAAPAVAAPAPSGRRTSPASGATEVGEALKALQTKIGPNLSEQLWNRFRLIRLQDALATDASRRAAVATLAELRRDVAAAAK